MISLKLYINKKGLIMEDKVTTIKIRKSTVEKLKEVSRRRNRKETMEQTILSLIDVYNIVESSDGEVIDELY
jgi:hypothetical protein